MTTEPQTIYGETEVLSIHNWLKAKDVIVNSYEQPLYSAVSSACSIIQWMET